jgi:predicted HAD superfamily Cof-like phosphohydrolase
MGAEKMSTIHILWTSIDPERPRIICNMNGDVVLSQCKLCGRAERELDEPCSGVTPPPFRERDDVRTFNEKYGVPMATTPSLLSNELFHYRVKFLHEELAEFVHAHECKDLTGVLDALVDLAYVLHGTALMMGLPWEAAWKMVHEKNMLKVRTVRAADSKRGSRFDVIKPPGWTPPDHEQHLGPRPWPVFMP